MECLLYLGVFAIIFLVGFVIDRKMREARAGELENARMAWASIAQSLGMKFTPGSGELGPSVSGEYRNRTVMMDVESRTEIRGRYSEQFFYTSAQTAIQNKAGARLSLVGREVGPQIVKAITNSGSAEVGDPYINERYEVGVDPNGFLPYLLSVRAIRETLHTSAQLRLQVSGDFVRLSYRVLTSEIETLRAILEAVMVIADAVEAYSGEVQTSVV